MNKIIILGCIVAVIFIVLASFVNVVGYQTTQYTLREESPLFFIRTKRAVYNEQEGIVTNYLGKNEKSTVAFPTKNFTNTVVELFSRLNKLNEIQFTHFLSYVRQYLKGKIAASEKQCNEVQNILIQVKEIACKFDEKTSMRDPEFQMFLSKFDVKPGMFYTCGTCAPPPTTYICDFFQLLARILVLLIVFIVIIL